MKGTKADLLHNLGYTALVYGRITKKLQLKESNPTIEKIISSIIAQTPEENISKSGKNYYVLNQNKNIRITINSTTHSVITVDRILK